MINTQKSNIFINFKFYILLYWYWKLHKSLGACQ